MEYKDDEEETSKTNATTVNNGEQTTTEAGNLNNLNTGNKVDNKDELMKNLDQQKIIGPQNQSQMNNSQFNPISNTSNAAANEDDTIPYYAHCISRTGSYLSRSNGIEEGEAIAYLIAPPLEAMYAIDAAVKAADVSIIALYNPPSETNFGGGLLTGTQSACKAACDAFAAAVEFVADQPKE